MNLVAQVAKCLTNTIATAFAQASVQLHIPTALKALVIANAQVMLLPTTATLQTILQTLTRADATAT